MESFNINYDSRKNFFISGTKIRNFILKDPLLDFLDFYYDKSPFINKDNEQLIENNYLCDLGNTFESNISKLLNMQFPDQIIKINTEGQEGYTKKNYERTIEAMKLKIPIIEQGVLFNYKNGTCGIPDLIVRSDYINKIVSKNVNVIDNNRIYYVIVDIKFTSIHLCSNNLYIKNTGRIPSYKTQLYIYNMALAEIQGYFPTKAYIMAKRYVCLNQNKNKTVYDTFEQLAEIDYNLYDRWCDHEVYLAINWLTDLYNNGSLWNPYKPHRWELYPNMSNLYDDKWHKVKLDIALKINELTLIWNVGFSHRIFAHKNNIKSYLDENCTSLTLGMKQDTKTSKIIDNILWINKQNDILIRINNLDINYIPDYYIDFETINGIVFMIGIYSNNDKSFVNFSSNLCNVEEEDKLYDQMINYIGLNKNIVHWSHAEITNILSKNSVILNVWHNNNNFIDLYKIFNDNIVVKDAFDFKLKSISNAMYKHKLIQSTWTNNGPHNGLEAMIEAIQYYDEYNEEIMTNIRNYNEIDCKVLYEIYSYLLQLL